MAQLVFHLLFFCDVPEQKDGPQPLSIFADQQGSGDVDMQWISVFPFQNHLQIFQLPFGFQIGHDIVRSSRFVAEQGPDVYLQQFGEVATQQQPGVGRGQADHPEGVGGDHENGNVSTKTFEQLCQLEIDRGVQGGPGPRIRKVVPFAGYDDALLRGVHVGVGAGIHIQTFPFHNFLC